MKCTIWLYRLVIYTTKMKPIDETEKIQIENKNIKLN